jgi:hypothetical protein
MTLVFDLLTQVGVAPPPATNAFPINGWDVFFGVVIVPNLASWLSGSHWSSQAKAASAIVISVLAAVASCLLAGTFNNATSIAQAIGVVILAAPASYELIMKNLTAPALRSVWPFNNPATPPTSTAGGGI